MSGDLLRETSFHSCKTGQQQVSSNSSKVDNAIDQVYFLVFGEAACIRKSTCSVSDLPSADVALL